MLARIDNFYDDRSREGDSVVTALIQRLSEPSPKDVKVTEQLASYKGLDPKWHTWSAVTEYCGKLALRIAEDEQ